jgi:hypothetical protein
MIKDGYLQRNVNHTISREAWEEIKEGLMRFDYLY